MNLIAVDNDPFASTSPSLIPVDHDPFAAAPGAISSSLKGASRALESNLPFVDRAVATAKSALPQGYGGTGQDYATNLAVERAKNAQFASDNPVTNFVGGAAAYAPAALIGGGATLPARIGSSALTGFGLGGLQGASSSPDLTNAEETGPRIAQGELSGGALGAFFPAAGHAIGGGVSALASALKGGPGTADLAALQTAKQAAYQNVKDMGAAYSPEAFKSLTDEIAAGAKQQGINPSLHPGAASVISDMQARAAQGTPVSLPELDQIRQIAWRDSASKPDAGERFFGNQIRNKIDEHVNAAFPGDMAPMPSATPEAAQPASAPAQTIERPQVPPGPAPTPLLDVMRRYGLQDEGGDLKSMGFADKYSRAPKGTLKAIDKAGGVPMDEGMRVAKELGYMEPHEDLSDFIDKLGQHPTYSVHDQEAVAARAARDAYDFGVSDEPQGELGNEEHYTPVQSAPSAIAGPVASAKDAADAIRNARDFATRQFKAQALATALSKAEDRSDVSGTGGNIENTTRQKLLIARDKEPWSPDELAQLNTMIHGTPVTNTLRQFSRFGPKGNALMTALELGAIGTGNPPLMAAGILGTGAQAANALMRRNAQNRLMATIFAGGKAPAAAAVPQQPSRAAMAAALAANADLQARRNQTTQP